MTDKWIPISFVLLFLSGMGCSSVSKEQQEMERRIMADSTFVKMEEALEAEMDSFCRVYQQAHWQILLDSILQDRQKQVNRQLEKNKKRGLNNEN